MIRCLFMLGVEPITSVAPCELHVKGTASVFLNGQLLGLHRRPHKLVHIIRCACGAARDRGGRSWRSLSFSLVSRHQGGLGATQGRARGWGGVGDGAAEGVHAGGGVWEVGAWGCVHACEMLQL